MTKLEQAQADYIDFLMVHVIQREENVKAHGRSQYLGVCIRRTGRISSQISRNKKIVYIGSYNTEVEAARAYDKKAKELFGEFANLNFK